MAAAHACASDNETEFHAMIEECHDGQWRVSGFVSVEEGNATLTQTSGIEVYPSEDAAMEWIERAAATHGFTKYKLNKKLLPAP
jgi:hypothetical protein